MSEDGNAGEEGGYGFIRPSAEGNPDDDLRDLAERWQSIADANNGETLHSQGYKQAMEHAAGELRELIGDE